MLKSGRHRRFGIRTITQQKVRDALKSLGIDTLVLAIHDQSFPSLPEEELGRGTPYSNGGRKFTQFISDLGFNAIQLGPQGKTSRSNPSPYDSTLFSKNELSISLMALTQDDWGNLLAVSDVVAAVEGCPALNSPRNGESYRHAWDAVHKSLRIAYTNFMERTSELTSLHQTFARWSKEHSHWLNRDALFEAMAAEYSTENWREWGISDQHLCSTLDVQFTQVQEKRINLLREKHAAEIDFFKFCQFVAHEQHQQYRKLTESLALRQFADLQIGYSQRDFWAARGLFLKNYLLGAPPSRTNPDGQPWGYPVLDPELYFDRKGGKTFPGPALRWMRARVDKLLVDFDGLRLDHPHGLVCPWVYRDDEENALKAVQQGARLFESPSCVEHPRLAKYAIARQEQLNTEVPPYADGWVKELTEAQVEKYGVLIETVKQRMEASGRRPVAIICEVLSSCPYPLRRMLQQFGLGRFRVTQKANPTDPTDAYRSDTASAADWIMVGTHDTKPIWRVVNEWTPSERAAWAEYLSTRLEKDEKRRNAFATELATNQAKLIEAMFADLFVGPARNVSIFFPDLLGIDEIYNAPGVISDYNWVLSVPNDYESAYAAKLKNGLALSLPRVLALALRAKGDIKANTLADELVQLADQQAKEQNEPALGQISLKS